MKLSNDVEKYKIEVTKMGQNYSFFLTVYGNTKSCDCDKHLDKSKPTTTKPTVCRVCASYLEHTYVMHHTAVSSYLLCTTATLSTPLFLTRCCQTPSIK